MVVGEQDGQRLEPDDLGDQGCAGATAGPVGPPEPDVDLPGQQAARRPGHPAAVHPAEVEVGRGVAGGLEGRVRPVRRPSLRRSATVARAAGRARAMSHRSGRGARGRERAGCSPAGVSATRRVVLVKSCVPVPLEAGDVAAQRLLGDEQPRCSPREVELLRGRHEIAKGPEVELASDRRRFVIHATGRLIPRVKVLDLEPSECEAGRRPIRPQRRLQDDRRSRSRHPQDRPRQRTHRVRMARTDRPPLGTQHPCRASDLPSPAGDHHAVRRRPTRPHPGAGTEPSSSSV